MITFHCKSWIEVISGEFIQFVISVNSGANCHIILPVFSENCSFSHAQPEHVFVSFFSRNDNCISSLLCETSSLKLSISILSIIFCSKFVVLRNHKSSIFASIFLSKPETIIRPIIINRIHKILLNVPFAALAHNIFRIIVCPANAMRSNTAANQTI